MHRRPTTTLLSALVALALLAALPSGAGAQAGARFPTVLLSAKTTQGRFQGAFVIRRFRVRAPGLAVFGRLSGTLRDRRYPSRQRVRNRPFSFTVVLARVTGSGSCARIAINVAPRVAPIVGLPAAFGPHRLVLRPHRGTGPSTGELLCGVSAAVAVNAPPVVTVHLLNALRLEFA